MQGQRSRLRRQRAADKGSTISPGDANIPALKRPIRMQLLRQSRQPVQPRPRAIQPGKQQGGG